MSSSPPTFLEERTFSSFSIVWHLSFASPLDESYIHIGNLSPYLLQGVYSTQPNDDGWVEGWKDGCVDGPLDGADEGLNDGLDEGPDDGPREGPDDGSDDGCNEGAELGMCEGLSELAYLSCE